MSEPTAAAMPADLAATPARKLGPLRQLLPFLLPYRKQFALAGLALLAAAAATLSVPMAFRGMIDGGWQGATSALPNGFLLLFGLAILLAIATAARFYMVSWLGERVTADLRKQVYSHILRQSPLFFETTRTGEVLSRLTTDTSLIQTVVGTSISMALRNCLLLAGGLLMMLITSTSLTLMILVLLLAVILPILHFGKRVRSLSRQSQDSIADFSALAGEILNAMPTIQAFTRESAERERFGMQAEKAFDSGIRRIRARALLTMIAITLVFGAIILVLWLGAQRVAAGEMSSGQLAQFILYASIVAGAFGALSEVLGDAQRAAGATERLLALMAYPPDIQDPPHPKLPPETGNTQGATLSLSALRFSYPSRPQQLALDNIRLQIAAGETVALVGSSGAGKSTLFQLILRFYESQQGEIALNGQDIRDYRLQDLRQRIGIVPQDTVIFSDNALENIRIARPEASDAEVMEAAKQAAAHDFLSALPEGYHTFLGERGVRLSGGQRQRIAIARVLLKNPPLLLLDEATSALDAESEQRVQAALERAMTGRTTLIIAHRLATIQKADRIIVMDQGSIVETGTHQDLLQQQGIYARLASLQFGLNSGPETLTEEAVSPL
ncbi:ABC transporter transmembrane domain-containing protein [Undibacterium squillarum]|uniref:ABC transporter transmembrane domain-containing protein n=1 Tax=Undibacterium squillarum TaxID=1131567 RepID=UPI0035B42D00